LSARSECFSEQLDDLGRRPRNVEAGKPAVAPGRPALHDLRLPDQLQRIHIFVGHRFGRLASLSARSTISSEKFILAPE